MLTLEEARSIQVKRQKSAVTKFLIHLVIVLILNGIADVLFARFQADSRFIPLLAFLSVLYLGWMFVRCKMHYFFRKKEYTGTVIATRADALPTHTSAANIPGERYRTVDQHSMQITILTDSEGKSQTPKTHLHECVLTEELKTLRDGEQVVVLRFIDQPIRLHPEEQT